MSKKPRELSIRSCIIGIFLAVLLCGANTYLGLKLGTTISASIPASIISMGILRMLKKYSILENNISQTIASAGKGTAGMVIFVFPALLILGTWKDFNYFTIFLMAICGGIIGVVFSVILRRALLGDKTLPFPEGQAIGNLLLATQSAGKTLKTLVSGILISGIFNFGQSGLQVFSSGYQKFINFRTGVIGSSIGFSPAAIGAGYLIGVNIIQHSQNWDLLLYGILIGFSALILDQIGLKTKKFRCPINYHLSAIDRWIPAFAGMTLLDYFYIGI